MPETSESKSVAAKATGSLWWLIQCRVLIDAVLIGGGSIAVFSLPEFHLSSFTFKIVAGVGWLQLAQLSGVAIAGLTIFSTSRRTRKLTLVLLSLFMLAMTQGLTVSLWLPLLSDWSDHELVELIHSIWLASFLMSTWAIVSLGLLIVEQRLTKRQAENATHENKWTRWQLLKRAVVSPLLALLLLITIFSVKIQSGYLVESLDSYRWQTAPAEIVESKTGLAPQIAVKYHYEVAGREFTGRRLTALPMKNGWNEDPLASSKIHQLSPGSIVPVYFNPSQPSQSVLTPGLSNFGLLILWYSLIFGGCLAVTWRDSFETHLHRNTGHRSSCPEWFMQLVCFSYTGFLGILFIFVFAMLAFPIDVSALALVCSIAIWYRLSGTISRVCEKEIALP